MRLQSRPVCRRWLSCIAAGFTLVEVLASVTIIGILVFLAIPSITSVRRDTEENMAIARAEALNMSISSYIQARGFENAKNTWNGATGADDAAKAIARYGMLQPYLAYAPDSLAQFMPAGYTVELPTDLTALDKVVIRRPSSVVGELGTQIEY